MNWKNHLTVVFVAALISGCGDNEDAPPPKVNTAPVAFISAPASAQLGESLQFDASASRDPDGDTLRYVWSIAQAPGSSKAQLVNASTAKASFVPDVAGVYDISLTISDAVLSQTSSVRLTATIPPFGPGTGYIVFPVAADGMIFSPLLTQPDGKYLGRGYITNGIYGTATQFLVRLNRDGSPDTGFGKNGRVSIDSLGTPWNVSQTVVLADGKILAAGNYGLVRLNTDGTLDSSYGPYDGSVAGLEISNLKLLPDGSVLMAGRDNLGLHVAKFDANGKIVRAFGVQGRVSITETLTRFFFPPSGGFLAVRVKYTPGSLATNYELERYTAEGKLDLGWGNQGRASTAQFANYAIFPAVAFPTDGKILLGGLEAVAGSAYALARFNADGSRDSSFGTDGRLEGQIPGADFRISDLEGAADGSIYLGGLVTQNNNNSYQVALVHLNKDGSIDTSFGTAGLRTQQLGSFSTISTLDLGAEGKLIATGSVGNDGAYFRFLPNGELDK